MPLTKEEQAELDQLNAIQSGKQPGLPGAGHSGLTPAEQAELDQLNAVAGKSNPGKSDTGKSDWWTDVKHGALPFAVRGAEQTRSMFGDLGDLALSGIEKYGKGITYRSTMPGGSKLDPNQAPTKDVDLGEAAHAMREQNRPNTSAARIEEDAARHPNWDINYQPTSRPGQYLEKFMSMGPQSAIGGVPALVKSIPAAIGSVEGGKAGQWVSDTAKGLPDSVRKWAKPAGEILGGALGWGTPAIVRNRVVPNPVDIPRTAAVNRVREAVGSREAVSPGEATRSWKVETRAGPASPERDQLLSNTFLRTAGLPQWDPNVATLAEHVHRYTNPTIMNARSQNWQDTMRPTWEAIRNEMAGNPGATSLNHSILYGNDIARPVRNLARDVGVTREMPPKPTGPTYSWPGAVAGGAIGAGMSHFVPDVGHLGEALPILVGLGGGGYVPSALRQAGIGATQAAYRATRPDRQIPFFLPPARGGSQFTSMDPDTAAALLGMQVPHRAATPPQEPAPVPPAPY